jgi:hypothetical protein
MNAYENRARFNKALRLAAVLRGKITAEEVARLPDDAWEQVAALADVTMPSVATRAVVGHIFYVESEVTQRLAVAS